MITLNARMTNYYLGRNLKDLPNGHLKMLHINWLNGMYLALNMKCIQYEFQLIYQYMPQEHFQTIKSLTTTLEV